MSDLYSLPVHPAADLFPRMFGQELEKLAEDIKKNGQRHPVVVYDRMGKRTILDGRNRLAACKIAGVEPTHIVWVGNDPIAYIASANLQRRHLDETQRAVLAVGLVEAYAAEAKKRKGGRPKKGDKGPTANVREVSSRERHQRESASKAAHLLSVSPRLVQGAKKVKAKAPHEVTRALEAGKVTIHDALQVLEQSAHNQIEALAKVEAGEAKTLKEAIALSANVLARETSTGPVVQVRKPTTFERTWASAMKLSPKGIAKLHQRLGEYLEKNAKVEKRAPTLEEVA